MLLAMWLVRPGSDPRIAGVIQRAAQRGHENHAQTISMAASDLGLPQSQLEHYFRMSLSYDWGEQQVASLARFGEELNALGLVAGYREPAYFNQAT